MDGDPYWQHFNGERYFRHELPCDPLSLVRWRQRIGEEGCEWLLARTIEVAKAAGVIKRRSMAHMVLDTTVQPKAMAHPTDSRVFNRAREQLVDVAGPKASSCAIATPTPSSTSACGARSASCGRGRGE